VTAPALSRLFVYGTLREDTVVQEILGRRPPRRPAVLRGYRRAFDEAIGYPVIRPDPASSVRGSVLDEIDAQALALLDAYEGRDYERIVVQVDLPGGAPCAAYAYVPAGARRSGPTARCGPGGERGVTSALNGAPVPPRGRTRRLPGASGPAHP
jgi:gamma-glutamylcyclotransferase (GGCT)/AIG2-like uncharacterized protein YtfP